MAQYKNIFSLSDIEWIKFYYDWKNRNIVMVITHRNIKITDSIDYDDQYDFDYVIDFIYKRFKEINYYLDAIWC